MTDPGIHEETEDLRSKMIDSDVVTTLSVGLSDQSWHVRQSTVVAIGELAKHGKFPDL